MKYGFILCIAFCSMLNLSCDFYCSFCGGSEKGYGRECRGLNYAVYTANHQSIPDTLVFQLSKGKQNWDFVPLNIFYHTHSQFQSSISFSALFTDDFPIDSAIANIRIIKQIWNEEKREYVVLPNPLLQIEPLKLGKQRISLHGSSGSCSRDTSITFWLKVIP